jgi:hypothetical protein
MYPGTPGEYATAGVSNLAYSGRSDFDDARGTVSHGMGSNRRPGPVSTEP